jgi:hypothetical protein
MTSTTSNALAAAAWPHGIPSRRPTTNRALVSLGVIAALVLAACSSGDTSVSDTTAAVDTTTATVEDDDDGELQDASSIRAQRAVAGDTFEIGEVATFRDVSLSINEVTIGGDDGGPWVAADTTVENRSERDATIPNLSIYCAGNEEPGGWQAFSTLSLGEVLPARSVDSGVVNLLAPGDERFGDGRPFCDTPAVIRVTNFGVNFALPDSIVDELNNTEPAAVRGNDPDAPVTTLTPEPEQTESATAADDAEFFDLVDQLNAAGVVCDNPRLMDPEPDEVFGLTPPDIELRCFSPEVGDVTFTRWSDASTLRGVSRVFIELGGAFGFDLANAPVLLLSDRTALWSDSNDITPDDPAVTAWLQSAQDVLGGNVITFAELAGS